MDSITIAWNKHSSDEVQFLTNRQYFQQDSKEKINNQDKKFSEKKRFISVPTCQVLNSKHLKIQNRIIRKQIERQD